MPKDQKMKSKDLEKSLLSDETSKKINDEDLEKISGGHIEVVDSEGNVLPAGTIVTNGITSTGGGDWA